jgi:anaerobic selenocysteine-containing dehydrogenase
MRDCENQFTQELNEPILKFQVTTVRGGVLRNKNELLHAFPLQLAGIVQDILPNSLVDAADFVLPMTTWAENEGCWENYQNRLQPYSPAIAPVEGARRPGDVYYELLGRTGLYNAAVVRREMGEPFASIALPTGREPSPAFEFVEL